MESNRKKIKANCTFSHTNCRSMLMKVRHQRLTKWARTILKMIINCLIPLPQPSSKLSHREEKRIESHGGRKLPMKYSVKKRDQTWRSRSQMHVAEKSTKNLVQYGPPIASSKKESTPKRPSKISRA